MGVLKRCTVSLAVFGAALGAAPQVHAQAIITNGTISLGVNPGGALNVGCDRLTPGAVGNPRCDYFFSGGDGSALNGNPADAGQGVGVMSNKSRHEFTYDGCTCEGWGAGISGGTFDGTFDGQNTFEGPFNPTNPPTFTFDATSATSTVDIGCPACASPIMRVTQFYHPSATADLYQVDVTITNLTNDVLGVGSDGIRYRREMDWDIEPTAFDEYSTIHGNGATDLLGTSDNGFANSNPFTGRLQSPFCTSDTAPVDADFYHNGPCDHGAMFDFGFPALGAGGSHSFTIFYGVALDEKTALADLGIVGADDVYSFGQFDCAGVGAGSNTDNACVKNSETAIFGFKGVGGRTLGTPEPASFALLGTGLAGLAGFARRRRQSA